MFKNTGTNDSTIHIKSNNLIFVCLIYNMLYFAEFAHQIQFNIFD